MQPSADGSFFIDRNGALFTYILEYFRNGRLSIPDDWKRCDILRFYDEVKYFGIAALTEPVLLRLWSSNMIQQPAMKLQILQKLATICKNKALTVTLEHLRVWKLVYEHDAAKGRELTKYDFSFMKQYEKRRRCVVLLELEGDARVFGMLRTRDMQSRNSVLDGESFAFFEDGEFSTNLDLTKAGRWVHGSGTRQWLQREGFIPRVQDANFWPIAIRSHSAKWSDSSYIGKMAFNGEISYASNINKIEIWSMPVY